MTINWSRLIFGAAAAALVLLQQHDRLRAHGAEPHPYRLVSDLHPADRQAFNEGRLGVVQPKLARRYLVQAYRVLSGLPPIPGGVDPWVTGDSSSEDSVRDWLNRSDDILGIRIPEEKRRWRWFDRNKPVAGAAYLGVVNCPRAAFATANATLQSRIDRFGQASEIVRNWTRGQVAVFANCAGHTLTLPEDVPPTADALLRADRAYQIAAAYFYAMQYDEAERRFRAIGADRTSPWRPYGRYLAARAMIRGATVPVDESDLERLREARTELTAILADTAAAPVHASTRGLIDFIDVRLDLTRQISRTAAALVSEAPSNLGEYKEMMDRLVGNTVDYEYDAIPNLEAARSHDLTDWVLAFQGRGSSALERTARRWQQTKSLPWLIAFLSKLEGPHPSANAALEAAHQIPADSPGFETLLYLRPRTLIRLGRHAEARKLLAVLPAGPDARTQRETANYLRSLRLPMATSYDEFWRNAPRDIAEKAAETSVDADRKVHVSYRDHQRPVLDNDSTPIVNRALPLRRLVDAALMPQLPDHVRMRIAVAALTRSIVLDRHDDGIRVARELRRLLPALAADLDAYVATPTVIERRRAALVLLLRTPRLRPTVPLQETDGTFNEPARGYSYRSGYGGWWCATREPLLQPPAFVDAAERAAADTEHDQFVEAGHALEFIGAGILEWATQEPTRPELAELLSLLVHGWRRSCRDSNSDIPRQAFQLLHRRFPQSEWAKRTKYWYR